MFGFLKNYIQDKISVAKIDLLDSLSQKGGEFGYLLLLFANVILFFIFLNFAVLFYLAKWIGSFELTFIVFASFYALISILIYFFRKSIMELIQNRIISLLASVLFKESTDEKKIGTYDKE